MKKIYQISGLDCANCAAKLEDQLNKIDAFDEVNLDFMKSKLTIQSNDHEIYQKAMAVISKVEPGVKLKEINPMTMARKQTFILEGLGCANCAKKIEDKVAKLEGVEHCDLNFMKKSLTITSSRADLKAVVQTICNDTEHGIKVVQMNQLKTMRGKSDLKQASTHQYIYRIEGLDCANCAAKLEHHLNALPYVSKANLNFIQKKLYLTTSTAMTLTQLNEEISKVESGVLAMSLQSKESSVKKTTPRYDLMLRIALVVVGLIITLAFPNVPPIIGYGLMYLGIGYQVLKTALSNMKRKDFFDENFLMTLATLGALAIGEYPEAIAVMLFYEVGEYFQGIAVDSSRRSIESLMNIRPDMARLKIGDTYKEVNPEEVLRGDYIEIRAGERVPIDGTIVEGESVVDTFSMTGESAARHVGVGDPLISGFVNKSGTLVCQVTSDYSESAVSRILDLVENATSKKAKTEKLITRFARVYTPVVVALGLFIAFGLPLLLHLPLKESIYKGMVFLVVSCPCALVLSVPLGYFAGIGKASKAGILVKGSNYLEALEKVDTIVFDKTGTLTEGRFKVIEVHSDNEQILQYVAYAEAKSHHPIAVSIVEAYGEKIDLSKIENVKEIAGKGIEATVFGHRVAVGNRRLMDGLKLDCDNVDTYGSVVYVAIDGIYEGYIVVGDKLKPNTIEMVKKIKALGKKVVMLSGDVKQTALKIGEACGIDDVRYELLPDQKVAAVESLGDHVAFVGDGINDAPVLARSSVGISMGGLGSDAAIEASDIVLMDDNLMKIIDSIQIADKTKRIIYQNIIFSLSIKVIVMLLSVFGFASMWLGVFADVGVTLIAVLNSLRILKKS